MRVARSNLSVLFNRLYDRGDDRFEIRHPADQVGTLATVELGAHDESTVRFDHQRESYTQARREVQRRYGDDVFDDLPDPQQYVNAVLASGAVPIENRDELIEFLDRYGDPDLLAGHPPVAVGIDTNLLTWRVDRILGLRDPNTGIGYVNGFVLATGVRDELDWDYKCHDTDPFEAAYGEAGEEYWNQPLGAARVGRLGLQTYRQIRDIQQADEIESDEGDDAIVAAYDDYDRDHRSDVLLFSNDRTFVERARGHTLLSHRIEFPDDLPKETTVSWRELEHLLYLFAVVFGVLEVPATTVFGVWRGKDQLDWQHQRVKLDCRSPNLRLELEGDLSVVESFAEFEST
jgi:hypothetical protein